HALYALAFVLGGQPLPALLHCTFGLLTTALVFSLARRLAGPEAGWLAAILFAGMPLVTWEAGTSYIDLFVTAYTFGSLYALLRWWDDDRTGWLVLAAALGGMAIGTKLTSGLFLSPAILLATVAGFARYRRTSSAVPRLLAFLVPFVLVSSPWFARTWPSISQRALSMSQRAVSVGQRAFPVTREIFPSE